MFGISDRYIGTQVAKATLMAVTCMTLLIVLGNVFQKVRPWIVEDGLPPMLVAGVVMDFIPASFIYTIPWGFMIAVLLVFGKLHQDQEIGAIQLGGRSLFRIAFPAFFIGAVLSVICLWINHRLLPQCNNRIENIVYESVKNNPQGIISPGKMTDKLKGYKVFVQSKSADGGQVQSLHIFQTHIDKRKDKSKVDADTMKRQYVYAEDASLATDDVNKHLKLILNSTFIETRDQTNIPKITIASTAPLQVNPSQNQRFRAKTKTSDEIRSYNQSLLANNEKNAEQMIVRNTSEIIKRITFALASFSFAFIAVPLSIGKRRRESSTGLILALVIGAAYFLCSLIAEGSKTVTQAMITLWLPNILCILLGLWLFRRVRFL